MPSLFPGMDPYLESLRGWEDVHNSLIALMRTALVRALPRNYFAAIEERVYILPDEKHTYIYDVGLTNSAPVRARQTTGSTVVADRADPPFRISYYVEEARETYLAIYDVKDRSRVVTAIELLSPTNKDGRPGRESYLNKQTDLLASSTHFIEIDLLRAGTHTVAAPLDLLPKKTEWDYLVCLHRGGLNGEFETWPNRMRNRLPRITVPLDEGVPDIVLDLQAALERCYEDADYGRIIDYTKSPVPSLSPEDAAWADALLREKGLRP